MSSSSGQPTTSNAAPVGRGPDCGLAEIHRHRAPAKRGGQAALLWLAAPTIIAAAPKAAIVPGVVAVSAYSILSPGIARRLRKPKAA